MWSNPIEKQYQKFMLRFFRSIRRKLLGEGSLRKYLLYAGGEILLVVVGILIAIQINTWQEGVRDRKEELTALIDLKAEFESNKADLVDLILFKERMQRAWKDYLSIISDKSLPDAERAVDRPLTGDRVIAISNQTLASMLNTGKIDKIRNDSLKRFLFSWNDILDAYRSPEINHRKFNRENFAPYEISLKPLRRYEGIDKSFYTEEEILTMNIRAINDLTYQNYLLLNLHWLNNQLESARELDKIFNQVIVLLGKEIEARHDPGKRKRN